MAVDYLSIRVSPH